MPEWFDRLRGTDIRRFKDKYNQSWQMMTPVLSVITQSGRLVWLWLGSRNAAKNTNLLRDNNVRSRMSMLGRASVPHKSGITDLLWYDMNRVVGVRGDHGLWPELQSLFQQVAEELYAGKDTLVFCQQGARRSAAFVGAFIMMLTGQTGKEVYDYLKGVSWLRGLFEGVCLAAS